MHHNVKAIQDMKSLIGFLGDDLQIRLPHITTNVLQSAGSFLAEPVKEPNQCLGFAVFTDP